MFNTTTHRAYCVWQWTWTYRTHLSTFHFVSRVGRTPYGTWYVFSSLDLFFVCSLVWFSFFFNNLLHFLHYHHHLKYSRVFLYCIIRFSFNLSPFPSFVLCTFVFILIFSSSFRVCIYVCSVEAIDTGNVPVLFRFVDFCKSFVTFLILCLCKGFPALHITTHTLR